MKNSRTYVIFRRLTILIVLLLISGLIQISAQKTQEKPLDWEEPDSCTSIMVGRLASTDGSVMTAHSCDGNYRTWVNIVPPKKHPKGTKTKIYHGILHNETPWDMRRVTVAGEIPQVEETYAYLNTAYPCMNEKQLAIGETTFGGRRELYNTEGLFQIENLQRIALERCTTAREAIKLIGELVKEYGYCDWGECLTFADPKEVWQFEIMGAGPLEIGAVWAAQTTLIITWLLTMCTPLQRRWVGGTPTAESLLYSGRPTAAAGLFRTESILCSVEWPPLSTWT
jgi:hypothetical protein